MCKAALPRHVSSAEAAIILFFNIFLPGTGTMLASIMGRACRCDTFLVGCLQFVTWPLIVGWIWSIWWGIAACGRVGKSAREEDVKHDSEQRRKHKKSKRSGSHASHRSGSHRSGSRHSGEDRHGRSQRQDQSPQQGFPQAYPDPTYPPPAYSQPYPPQAYPSDYPPVPPS